MHSDCPSVTSVEPGLGFRHLSAAQPGWSGARGLPLGEPGSSAGHCCSRCASRPPCNAWVYRPAPRAGAGEGRCLLGNCSLESACFERLDSTRVVGGSLMAVAAATLVCDRPDASLAAGAGDSPSRARHPAARHSSGGDGLPRLALLILGHRSRLMFETVPTVLIQPLTKQVRLQSASKPTPPNASSSMHPPSVPPSCKHPSALRDAIASNERM